MENDNLNIEQELDQMKQQYALLQEELNQQHIADEKLLFETANNRLRDWQRRQIKAIALVALIFIPSVILITVRNGDPIIIIAAWGMMSIFAYHFFSRRKAYQRCTTLEEVVDTMAYINSITPEPLKVRLPKSFIMLFFGFLLIFKSSDNWIQPLILVTCTILVSLHAGRKEQKKQRQLFKGIEDIIEEGKKE